MTPIFLKNMGNYDYGIWEIIASVVGYMGILDLGIKPAITRFTAKYEVEKNQSALKVMYSSALIFTIGMGIFLCLLLVCWGVFYPETLAPNNAETTKYTLVLIILAIQMLFMFPGYVPESILEGFQLYHLKNNITIFNSIVGAIILYFFISSSNALYLLALINAVGLSVKYVCYFIIVTRVKAIGLSPSISNISLSELKKLLSFGGKSFIQGIAYRIESVTDVLVIGAFIGPAVVPFYSIPANLISHIRNVGFTLTQAFMPQFSQLFASNDQEAIRKLYINASKWIITIMLPLSILAVIFGPDFITLWLGKEYGEESQLILLLLTIFTMIPLLDPFKSRYLTAINKHAILAKLFPIAAFINLSVSILLVNSFGVVGVAVGSIIPVVIFMPIYLRYSCKQLGITVYRYISEAIIPLIPANLILAFSSFYTVKFLEINHYYHLIGYSGLNFVLYLLCVFITLNNQEKTKLKKIVFKNK